MIIAPLVILAGTISAFASAKPDVPLKEQLAARVLAELAKRNGRPPIEVARQLIGGGGDFAPYQVPCPANYTWIRPADGLSAGEEAYIQQRQSYLSAINTQMTARGLPQPARTPVIGLALSGGGYRAMTLGLGGVMGTMNQSAEAASSGVGGWLDGATYMAGLSGGSWGTGTFIANGGQLPTDLVTNLWDLQSNLILPDDDKVSFYYDLVSEVNAKSSQGFPTQITDYWGLALGNHLLASQYHLSSSPNLTFSSLPSVVGALGNASLPMPIIIAAEREAGEVVIAENATVWEFTPYEFGSWAFGSDTKVRGAFTPLEYLGTPVSNGQANGTCWKGFDQLSFVMGTSSTLFNGALLELNGTSTESFFTDALKAILTDIGEDEDDVSRIPNTFFDWNDQPNPISGFEYVTLVDGGETNQNIPIEPLLVPARNVDAIIAFDNSADTTYSWPNGTAIRTTFERASQLAQTQNVSIRMPEVPSENGFVNGGWNTRPTFFGCNDTTTPVIVYVPNYPWSYASNISTYQLEYDQDVATNAVLNGMRSLTLNGSVTDWPTCLACALTDRANDYTSANRSSTCQQCFDTWCWSGEDNQTTPSAEYEPVVGSRPAFLASLPSTSTQPSASTSQTQSAAETGGAMSLYRGGTNGWPGLAVVCLCVILGGVLVVV